MHGWDGEGTGRRLGEVEDGSGEVRGSCGLDDGGGGHDLEWYGDQGVWDHRVTVMGSTSRNEGDCTFYVYTYAGEYVIPQKMNSLDDVKISADALREIWKLKRV